MITLPEPIEQRDRLLVITSILSHKSFTAKNREVIRLRFFLGFTAKEVAALWGIGLWTARQHEQVALWKLRFQFRRHLLEELYR